jgi:hypothetical protein
VVWWWGQLGVNDAGPTKGINIHEKNKNLDPNSMLNQLKSSRRRGGIPGPSQEAKGPRFGSHSGTSLAPKSKKIILKGIGKSNTKNVWAFEAKGFPN